MATVDLVGIRALVQTPLAARFELEMFNCVGNKNCISLYSSVSQCLCEYCAGRANERLALLVFLIARLLSHHHDAGSRRPLAWHDLRRMFIERAPRAFLFSRTQGLQCLDRRLVWHACLMPSTTEPTATVFPCASEILSDPGFLHVLTP